MKSLLIDPKSFLLEFLFQGAQGQVPALVLKLQVQKASDFYENEHWPSGKH